MAAAATTVWVEKYRPTKFHGVVLDATNRRVLENVICAESEAELPHLLFFGPQGTGKTTTALNLIREYQRRRHSGSDGAEVRELVIHLNASDDRGIDVIRSQIHQFVNSKCMFYKGLKFVVLDEVDSMTHGAQQALRHILQSTATSTSGVRFILMCNYLCKLDDALRHEFVALKFDQLPRADILAFLRHISESEGLALDDADLEHIRGLFGSDLRSMVNFMQFQCMSTGSWRVPSVETVANKWMLDMAGCDGGCGGDSIADRVWAIEQLATQRHQTVKNVIKDIVYYMIRKSSHQPRLIEEEKTTHTPFSLPDAFMVQLDFFSKTADSAVFASPSASKNALFALVAASRAG